MDQENPNAEAFFNRIDQNTLTNVAREATLGNAALLRKNLREGLCSGIFVSFKLYVVYKNYMLMMFI